MNKRTFDLIANYISDEIGVKVVITKDVGGPQMSIDKKTIYLPDDIKEENALSALASLIHEAAHMKHTVQIPEGLAENETEHHILNAMEDVRIDRLNFRILPNIKLFYSKMYKEHSFKKDRKERLLKAPMLTRIMICNILYQECFSEFDCDHEAYQKGADLGINKLFQDGVFALEGHRWQDAIEIIREIIKLFKEDTNAGNQQKQSRSGGTGKSNGSGSGKGNTPNDCGGTEEAEEGLSGVPSESDPTGNTGRDDGSDEGEGDDTQGGESSEDIKSEDVDTYLHAKSVWGKGGGLKGRGSQGFSQVELKESTRAKFIDALSIKQKRKVEDGSILDTDNLIAFFTGEIKELFKDDTIIKKRKSKIVFAVDSSGSMGCSLHYGKQTSRSQALIGAVKSLTEILDQVRQVDGLEVDYEVHAFDDEVHLLDKDNWENDYYKYSGGGTWIWKAYDTCKDILMKDPETDGHKMLILVTDGEVSCNEIDQIKEGIMKDNADIRVMVIGVGANLDGRFVKTVVGDNNIITPDNAEEIIMDAIQTML